MTRPATDRHVDRVAKRLVVAVQSELPVIPQAGPERAQQDATTQPDTTAEARAKMYTRPEIMDHELDRSLQAAERVPDRDLLDRCPEGKDTRINCVHLRES